MSITADMKRAAEAGKAILELYSLEEVKEAIFKRNVPEDQSRIDFAGMLYQFGMSEEAYNLLKQINEDDLKNSKLFLMALCEIRKKDLEKAKERFEAILSINNRHGASLNNLGILEASNENIEKAQTYFEQALIDFPGYKDAEYNLLNFRRVKSANRP